MQRASPWSAVDPWRKDCGTASKCRLNHRRQAQIEWRKRTRGSRRGCINEWRWVVWLTVDAVKKLLDCNWKFDSIFVLHHTAHACKVHPSSGHANYLFDTRSVRLSHAGVGSAASGREILNDNGGWASCGSCLHSHEFLANGQCCLFKILKKDGRRLKALVSECLHGRNAAVSVRVRNPIARLYIRVEHPPGDFNINSVVWSWHNWTKSSNGVGGEPVNKIVVVDIPSHARIPQHQSSCNSGARLWKWRRRSDNRRHIDHERVV